MSLSKGRAALSEAIYLHDFLPGSDKGLLGSGGEEEAEGEAAVLLRRFG